MVDKLKWCFGKKEVKFIEPNENLANEYLRSAEETLLVLRANSKSLVHSIKRKFYISNYRMIYYDNRKMEEISGMESFGVFS